MKFHVFATDVLPLRGLPTTGTPLRTYGFVQGLRAHGHDVEVSVPRAALRGMLARCDLQSLDRDVRGEIDRLKDSAFDFTNQTSLVDAVRPDVVLCGHWPAATFPGRISPTLVMDLAGPHLLERHYQGTPDHGGAVLGKLLALSKADYFIVSGARQRLYFLSFMLRARVDAPETRTLTIHMPLSPDAPASKVTAACGEYPRLVFAGVFLPWQDPSLALDRTVAALAKRGRGSLTVIGGPHPSYPIAKGVYSDLIARLAKLPFVRTIPMIPYDQLVQQLLSSDAAIDLMRWNLERELAMTIRSTSYLWSGVPVIYNDYADLGQLIRQYDAGWTAAPSDPEAIDDVLDQVFDDPALAGRKSQNARRLAREVFSWDRAVVPLLDALNGEARKGPREIDIELARPEDATLAVLENRAVQQHFLSRIDGLTRVECCLATHARSNLKPIVVSLYCVAADASGREVRRELLASKRIAGDAIRNNEWQALELPPMTNSGGKRFVLSIESEARHVGESVSPWACYSRTFPILELFRGDQPIARTAICLRTVSCNTGSRRG